MCLSITVYSLIEMSIIIQMTLLIYRRRAYPTFFFCIWVYYPILAFGINTYMPCLAKWRCWKKKKKRKKLGLRMVSINQLLIGIFFFKKKKYAISDTERFIQAKVVQQAGKAKATQSVDCLGYFAKMTQGENLLVCASRNSTVEYKPSFEFLGLTFTITHCSKRGLCGRLEVEMVECIQC